MKLIVLAGGFGNRLKSALSDVPKPLAPVSGEPFLKLQIEHWRDQGLCDFTFLLHHKADQIIDFLQLQRSNSLRGCKVDWLVEPSPMDLSLIHI